MHQNILDNNCQLSKVLLPILKRQWLNIYWTCTDTFWGKKINVIHLLRRGFKENMINLHVEALHSCDTKLVFLLTVQNLKHLNHLLHSWIYEHKYSRECTFGSFTPHLLKHTREKCKWQLAYKCLLTEDPFFGLFRLIFVSCFQTQVPAVKASADDFVHFVLRFKQ